MKLLVLAQMRWASARIFGYFYFGREMPIFRRLFYSISLQASPFWEATTKVDASWLISVAFPQCFILIFILKSALTSEQDAMRETERERERCVCVCARETERNQME